MPAIFPAVISALTARQEQILRFIGGRMRSAGSPPTVREIGERFGISSTGAVRNHLAALFKKGVLRKVPGVSRGLRLASHLEEEGASRWGEEPHTQGIPILGQVVAGQPLLSEEALDGHIGVDRSLLPRGGGSVFALRVKGDSMAGAGIQERDLVLVRKQEQAESGDVVVGVVDGEATVKRFKRRGRDLWLEPENPAYRPIRMGQKGGDRIIGKVVGLIRRFS